MISGGVAVQLGIGFPGSSGAIYNDGGIYAGTDGLRAVQARDASVVNGQSGLIVGVVDTAIPLGSARTVTNLGVINGEIISGYGQITNGAPDTTTALINNSQGRAIDTRRGVTNFGTIISGANYPAIGQSQGSNTPGTLGTIANGAPTITSAYIKGGSNGVVTRQLDVTNFGTMMGSAGAGLAADSGTFTNGSTADTAALITGATAGAQFAANWLNSTITNFGTILGTGPISNGIHIDGTVTLVNGISGSTIGLIQGVERGLDQVWAMYNYGSIAATSTAGIALALTQGITAINHGQIAATAGVGVLMGGVPMNNAADGTIAGASYGVRWNSNGAPLVNSGLITSTPAGTGIGVLGGAMAATNTALGTIAGGAIGASGNGTLTNYGLVTGAIGLSNIGSVITAGTIIGTGGTAAALGAYASLTLLPGATFTGLVTATGIPAHHSLTLGSAAATGTISGLGTAFTNFGNLTILPAAHWILTGTNDLSQTNVTGQFTIDNGALNISPGTTLTAQGSIATQGATTTIVNQGTIATVLATGLQIDAPIVNTGTVTVLTGSTLRITGIVTGALPPPPPAGVIITSEGAEVGGRFNLDTGAVAEFSAALDASQTIGFGTTDDVSQITVDDLPDFQAAMADFGVGDSVDISGVSADFGDIADTAGTNVSAAHATAAALVLPAKTLRISNNGTILKTIPLTGANTAPYVHLQPDGHGGTLLTGSAVACFAQGTRIDTPTGPIPVEHLRIGDQVINPWGETLEITWLGHRRTNCRRHPRPWDVQPIRVAAHAFAPGQPRHDLLLSPDHAIYLPAPNGAPDVLIPVRYLTNGATIAQQDVDTVTYWHVELFRHDVLLAEGLPCESYLDTGNRRAFENAPLTALHPDFPRDPWSTLACAPLALTGPAVTATRAHLLARAKTLGHAQTPNPALQLLANTHPIPHHQTGTRIHAALPPGTTTLRLLSRIWTPAHMHPTESDTRPLGIALAHLTLDGHPIPLDHPSITTGWHPPEPTWRWTTGTAEITIAGARSISFDLTLPGTYWETPASEDRVAAR